MFYRVASVVCLLCIPACAGESDRIKLARSMRVKGDYQSAEKLLREEMAQPLEAKARIAVVSELADLLREEDRRSEARNLFTEALNSEQADWSQKFASLLGLGDVERQEQNWPASIERLDAAADLARTHHDDLLEAFAQRSLGETWLDQGNTARAEPLLKRSLAVLDASPYVSKERVAVALDSMASLYMLEDKQALAEGAWMRELTIHREVLGEYHPQTAVVMGRLAQVWAEEGDLDKARSWAQQSSAIMKSHFGEDSAAAGSALVNMGMVEQRAHNLESAANMYSRALAIYRDKDATGGVAKEIAQLYAGVLSQMHKGREAKQVIAAFHLK